ECDIWFSFGFLRWTRTVSPTWTRITGPGTVPPNVQTFWTKPSATVISCSVITRSMSCTFPGSAFGAVGSYRTGLGAVGSAAAAVGGGGPAGGVWALVRL